MCSETSPRISFSQDLGHEDDASIEQVVHRRDLSLLDSNSDFEFSICSNFEHDTSLADEIFLDGMILPFQVQDRSFSIPTQTQQQKHNTPLLSLSPFPTSSGNENSRKENIKEVILVNSDLEDKPQPSKSFWGFKRSTSLNCDIKRSLIRSLPLLSRSNSTGSVPNPKQTTLKDIQRHNQQKQQLTARPSPSSSSSASGTNVYPLSQKPPLKKNHGNKIRISPLLNVPPPPIPKGTANLLGLGFLYKDKKKKK